VYNNEIMRDIVPIKMYEYLAMHKPVIATRLPGIVLEFGMSNGVMYVNTPYDIVNKVLSLSEYEINQSSVEAKNFIENYSWDKIIDHFENILDKMLCES